MDHNVFEHNNVYYVMLCKYKHSSFFNKLLNKVTIVNLFPRAYKEIMKQIKLPVTDTRVLFGEYSLTKKYLEEKQDLLTAKKLEEDLHRYQRSHGIEEEKENVEEEKDPVESDINNEFKTVYLDLCNKDNNDPGKHIVDFDFAWKASGYSRKDIAKRTMERCLKKEDYVSKLVPRTKGTGTLVESITLTLNAAKLFWSKCQLPKAVEISKFVEQIDNGNYIINEEEQKQEEKQLEEFLSATEKQDLEVKFTELFELEQSNPKGFVVDFNLVWKLVGYSRKNDAKKVLLSSGLEEGSDYQCGDRRIEKHGGKPALNIMLTIDAAKQFWLSARTEKAKQVRKYFIDVEKRFQLLKHELNTGRLALTDTQTGEIYKEKTEQLEIQNSLLIEEKENKENEEQRKNEEFLVSQQYYLNTLISSFEAQYDRSESDRKNIFYLAYVGTHIDPQDNINKIWIKYGITKRSIQREKEHLSRDFDQYEIFHVKECDKANFLEEEFRKKLKKFEIHRENVFNGQNQRELFVISFPLYDTEHVLSRLEIIEHKYADKIEIWNHKKEQELVELKHKLELLEMQHKLKIQELEFKLQIQELQSKILK